MLAPGETIIGLPVVNPGFHVYDNAPEAVSVEVPPTQIPVGFAVAVTLGRGLTVKEIVVVFIQLPLVPVKV